MNYKYKTRNVLFTSLSSFFRIGNRGVGTPAIYILTSLLILFLSQVNAAAISDADNLYRIASPISSGVIKIIHVREGQSVKKGDVLFEFDDRLINSNLNEAKALVRMQTLKVTEAKKEVERSEELYERTVLSDYDLQQSKILYSEALAGLAQAKNKLAHAQWDKDYSMVYAPFDGKVVKILCYSGCYINNNVATQAILILAK